MTGTLVGRVGLGWVPFFALVLAIVGDGGAGCGGGMCWLFLWEIKGFGMVSVGAFFPPSDFIM